MALPTRRRQAAGSACAANARASAAPQASADSSSNRNPVPSPLARVPRPHRVGQPAGPPDDGHGPVAERDELAEPAGLVPGGHQEEVGAGVDPPGEALVEPDAARRPTRDGPRPSSPRRRSSGSSPAPRTTSWPPAVPDGRARRPRPDRAPSAPPAGSPPRRGAPRPPGSGRPISLPERGRAGGLAARGRPGRTASAMSGSVAGFQAWTSSPFRMPVQVRAPLAENAVQALPELRALDLAGIGRADRGEEVGEGEAALQQRQVPVELEPGRREEVPARAPSSAGRSARTRPGRRGCGP